jgi:hypothetical protein
MRRKSRLQPGSEADIVVFDPATVSDQAAYAQSTRPSSGIRHVLVNGELVVCDGAIVTAALLAAEAALMAEVTSANALDTSLARFPFPAAVAPRTKALMQAIHARVQLTAEQARSTTLAQL